jgi:hypothetical protein
VEYTDPLVFKEPKARAAQAAQRRQRQQQQRQIAGFTPQKGGARGGGAGGGGGEEKVPLDGESKGEDGGMGGGGEGGDVGAELRRGALEALKEERRKEEDARQEEKRERREGIDVDRGDEGKAKVAALRDAAGEATFKVKVNLHGGTDHIILNCRASSTVHDLFAVVDERGAMRGTPYVKDSLLGICSV